MGSCKILQVFPSEHKRTKIKILVGRIVVTVFAIGVFAMWMNLGMVGVMSSFNVTKQHWTVTADALDNMQPMVDIDIGAASTEHYDYLEW